MIEYARYIAAWMPQGGEWLVILLVALLLFGKRLPEIARSIGKSLTEFKKGINEAKETKDELVDDVRKTTDDIKKQAKDAAGLDDINSNN